MYCTIYDPLTSILYYISHPVSHPVLLTNCLFFTHRLVRLVHGDIRRLYILVYN